jgi:hypothetical protein
MATPVGTVDPSFPCSVLRPGGRLALFWHVFELPPDVAEAFVAVYQRVLPDSPFNLRAGTEQALEVYQVLFTKAADGIREVGGFSDPEQWRFDWERSYTRDEWLDQLPTFGPFTRLPSDTLAEVLQGVGAAIDAMGGRVTVRYTTVAVTAARTGAAWPAGRGTVANEPWPSHRGTLWSSWGWTSRRPWSSTTSRCTSAATIDLVTGNVLAALEPGAGTSPSGPLGSPSRGPNRASGR